MANVNHDLTGCYVELPLKTSSKDPTSSQAPNSETNEPGTLDAFNGGALPDFSPPYTSTPQSSGEGTAPASHTAVPETQSQGKSSSPTPPSSPGTVVTPAQPSESDRRSSTPHRTSVEAPMQVDPPGTQVDSSFEDWGSEPLSMSLGRINLQPDAEPTSEPISRRRKRSHPSNPTLDSMSQPNPVRPRLAENEASSSNRNSITIDTKRQVVIQDLQRKLRQGRGSRKSSRKSSSRIS
jgi:hypothetical protein